MDATVIPIVDGRLSFSCLIEACPVSSVLRSFSLDDVPHLSAALCTSPTLSDVHQLVAFALSVVNSEPRPVVCQIPPRGAHIAALFLGALRLFHLGMAPATALQPFDALAFDAAQSEGAIEVLPYLCALDYASQLGWYSPSLFLGSCWDCSLGKVVVPGRLIYLADAAAAQDLRAGGVTHIAGAEIPGLPTALLQFSGDTPPSKAATRAFFSLMKHSQRVAVNLGNFRLQAEMLIGAFLIREFRFRHFEAIAWLNLVAFGRVAQKTERWITAFANKIGETFRPETRRRPSGQLTGPVQILPGRKDWRQRNSTSHFTTARMFSSDNIVLAPKDRGHRRITSSLTSVPVSLTIGPDPSLDE
jgi:hypothetical protein